MKIDDSSLFHASGTYDPVKAREYYLRTRKLKGRRPSTASLTNPGRGGRRPQNAPKGSLSGSSSLTEKRRAELLAQRAALQQRLDRLQTVLREAVAAAKKRSGPAQPDKKNSDSKDRAPETTRDKGDREKESKKSKPETAAQKRERAKRDKESYEKEKKTSLSTDIKVLNAQIKDIKGKIAKALSDAEKRQKSGGSLSGSTAALTRRPSVRGSFETNSEPRGR